MSEDALPGPAALAELRHELERIDDDILALLGERVALAREIAGVKQAAGLPLLDPKREAEVIRRVMTKARERSLPVEPVREIFWLVIGLSRRAQEGGAA